MADVLTSIAGFLPWWAWLLAALACLGGFTLAWMSVLAVYTAYGANYRAMSPRQRRLGRLASLLTLLAVPTTAVLGVAALIAAVWHLLA